MANIIIMTTLRNYGEASSCLTTIPEYPPPAYFATPNEQPPQYRSTASVDVEAQRPRSARQRPWPAVQYRARRGRRAYPGKRVDSGRPNACKWLLFGLGVISIICFIVLLVLRNHYSYMDDE